MAVRLYPHQWEALDRLRTGSILCGGVGTGKSITSLSFFYIHFLGGGISKDGTLHPPKKEVPLYIISTARKRDNGEWEEECRRFRIFKDSGKIPLVIDSWNNLHKYENVDHAFFIFDEQRVVGSGQWVRSFLKIAKKNDWILLSATPGDTWMDYIPVFVANGFYKNRTAFLRQHAVYNRYAKYPKVDRFVETGVLERYRRQITVSMSFERKTVAHWQSIECPYDSERYRQIGEDRWDPYKGEPIQNISEVCYLLRKVCNSEASRIEAVKNLWSKHPRMIIFYNYDYELEALRTLDGVVAEWNGHIHQPVPDGERWAYLVQYAAGAEGWNCIVTDTIVFYSQSYSYKTMTQAAGRIDRLNTPFRDLHYYILKSNSPIDKAIARALKLKKNFNELSFLGQ